MRWHVNVQSVKSTGVTLGFLVWAHTKLKAIKDGTSVPKRLQSAYTIFRSYCKSMRETPMVKHFTKENLGWSSLRKFPECSFKGSDCRLLLGWLIHFVNEQNTPLDDVATTAYVAAMAIDNFLFGSRDGQGCRKTMITRDEAISCKSMLKVFLEQFSSAAKLCFDRGQCFFNFTPKFHYLLHVEQDLEEQILNAQDGYILSPACFATQMAEDATGRSCRMARTCHPNTSSLRVAQKWLICCKLFWDKWKRGENHASCSCFVSTVKLRYM